jgi:hypothetical protein
VSGHEHRGPDASREALAAGHEVGDIRQKPIYQSLIGLAVLSAVVFVFIVFFFRFLDGRVKSATPPMNPLAREAGTRLPPEPRLQVDAWKDWDDYKAAQDRLLHGYSWVNKEQGIVRVPIEKGIDMVLEKGLPARAGVAPPASLRMRAPVPATSPAGDHGATPTETPHGGGGGH